MDHKPAQIRLPNAVVGVMDVNRLVREMGSLDDFLHQANIREPGTPMSLPKMSKSFDEIVEQNGLNMLQEHDRKILRDFLKETRDRAPKLHVSFSVDPSPLFLDRLIDYLRFNIHPLVLIQVGLQPNIGAGCVVRSTNKVFDLSLRENFRSKRNLLLKYVSKLESEPLTEPQPAPKTQMEPQQPEPTA